MTGEIVASTLANFETFRPQMSQPITVEGALWADLNLSPTRQITDLLPRGSLPKVSQCKPGLTNDCLHIKAVTVDFQHAAWISYFTQCITIPCEIESSNQNSRSWEMNGTDAFPRFEWKSILSRLLNLTLPESIQPPEVTYTVKMAGIFGIWFKSIEMITSGIYQKDIGGKIFRYPFTARIPLVTEEKQLNGIFSLENICAIELAQIQAQNQTIRYKNIETIQRFYCPWISLLKL